MSNPLRADTIEKKIQGQPETRPATLEDRAATLRDLIARKLGNDRMLAGWRKDLAELQEQIEAGEAMKTNPVRTFGNTRLMTWEQLFEAAGDGTLIPDAEEEFNAAEAVKDVYPGEYKLVKSERGNGITDFTFQKRTQ